MYGLDSRSPGVSHFALITFTPQLEPQTMYYFLTIGIIFYACMMYVLVHNKTQQILAELSSAEHSQEGSGDTLISVSIIRIIP